MNIKYVAVIAAIIVGVIIALVIGSGIYACTKDGKGGWINCQNNEQQVTPKIITEINGTGTTITGNATVPQGGANPAVCPGNPTNAKLRVSIGGGAQGNVVGAKMNCNGVGEISDSPADPGDGSTLIGGGNGQVTGTTPSCKVDLSQVGNSKWAVKCVFG